MGATTVVFRIEKRDEFNAEYNKENGVHSQGAGWGLVDGKLLRVRVILC